MKHLTIFINNVPSHCLPFCGQSLFFFYFLSCHTVIFALPQKRHAQSKSGIPASAYTVQIQNELSPQNTQEYVRSDYYQLSSGKTQQPELQKTMTFKHAAIPIRAVHPMRRRLWSNIVFVSQTHKDLVKQERGNFQKAITIFCFNVFSSHTENIFDIPIQVKCIIVLETI